MCKKNGVFTMKKKKQELKDIKIVNVDNEKITKQEKEKIGYQLFKVFAKYFDNDNTFNSNLVAGV